MPTVAFDVIGTLLSLEPVRARLTSAGAPSHALDIWFAESLRDYFALSHAGDYAPLREVLSAALPRTLEVLGAGVDEGERHGIVAALGELEPVAGAADACAALADAGYRLITLTNGSEDSTRALLEGGGLDGWFEATLSCDAIRVSKPHARVYEMARRAATGELWLVAAHAWDVAGAARAGLRTAWVAGKEGRYLSVYPRPDISAPDLVGAARAIIDAAPS